MRRISIEPRVDWQSKVESVGLIFHTEEDGIYWNESAFYEFTESEIQVLEDASNALNAKCLEAVDFVIQSKRFQEFQIPEWVVPYIESSWESEPPNLYGRFDFVYDGTHPPKMLEYNADTPTALLEAAIVQWKWLEEVFPNRDQFNSIYEVLIGQWKWLLDQSKLKSPLVHFGYSDLWEDELTIAVLQETAHAAGLQTEALLMEEIGWDGVDFLDIQNRPISSLFKLYPWEWLVKEEFGRAALSNLERCDWIEPIWKMILSNKALLPILWEMFPNHPNLLESYSDGPREMTQYVKKAKLGREGSNVQIVSGDDDERNQDGPYDESGYIYQAFAKLPNFEGNRPVIGSWIIGDESCGIGIRETNGPITDNFARFVPHCIR